jgi:signal transduction histidine kinase/ligand-binding sensor domain-containing protein
MEKRILMIYKNWILAVLLLFVFHQISTAEQFIFSHYSVNNGLSQSVIKCIFQDSKGYIWFGTQQGLNRFNGYSFDNYLNNPADSNSISDNWIYSITEDNEGNIWIGTRNGLNKYIQKTGHFKQYLYNISDTSSISSNYIYGLSVDEQGNILANTASALNIIDPKTLVIKKYVNPNVVSNEISDEGRPILQTRDGNIWIASAKGLLFFDSNKKSFLILDTISKPNSFSNNDITALTEDSQGSLWIGTQAGLNRMNIKNFSVSRYYLDSKITESSNSNFIRSIREDRNRKLWIGTNGGGLFRLTFDRNFKISEQVNFSNTGQNTDKLSHNIVLSLSIDKSNLLWIGTLNGIDKIDLKKRKFNLYSKSNDFNSVDLLDNVIASLFEDKQNNLWIGNWGSGLNILDRFTNKVEHYTSQSKGNSHISNNFVHVIYQDSKNRIWIGTRDKINLFDKANKRFWPLSQYFKTDKLPDFQNIRVNDIFEDSFGLFWIATQNGLYKMDIENQKFEIFLQGVGKDNVSSNLVYCIIEDFSHNIWIGTTQGLDKYNRKENSFIHYQRNQNSTNTLCSNFIVSLCEDFEHNLWIGTTSGLNKFITSDSEFLYFSKNDGLPSNIIYEIQEDKNQNLWLATVEGLCVYYTKQKVFRAFEIEDGMQGREFNTASFRASDGELFFGGMHGVNFFYPDSVKDNNFIPPVVITNIEKLNSWGKQILSPESFENLKLSYLDYAFTIEFAALDFTSPLQNRYAYKMEGAADEWIDIGNRRNISFSNLPAGKYIFLVKGSNSDGIWNEKVTSLKIEIIPPIWKSKWAVMSYFILTIILIFLYVRNRERILVRERKILEVKVASRTKEIALQKEKIENAYINVKQLSEIGQKITENLTVETIINTVYQNLNLLMDASVLAIGIYNNEDKRLDFYGAIEKGQILDFHFDLITEINLPSVQCFLNKREIVYLSKSEYLERVSAEAKVGEMPESLVYLPLLKAENATGVLTVQSFNQNAYNDYHISILRNIAIYLTIALENADTFRLIKQQNSKLQESNATKDKLFSIIAHDLKNPFAVILSLSETLSESYRGLEEDELEECLKKMHSSAQKVYELLANLLTWSRSQTGNIQFNPEKLKLDPIVRGNAELLRNQYELKNIKLNIDVDPDFMVWADTNMLNTVLRNLISNAIKYTSNTGIINVSVNKKYDHVEIVIQDNGVGIHRDIIDKLFEIEHKVSSPGTNGEGGTGLGLILCKEFVEKHGGQIWLTSELGNGSSFYFTIPNGNSNLNPIFLPIL